jgi:hypothetical protein
LLRLARGLNEQQRVDEAWDVLDLIPDETDDPEVAAEKVHLGAMALIFRDPASGLPGLDEAVRRWSALGNAEKYGWALANRGVALFFLGRNRESERALRDALAVFTEVGDRDGQMAAYRFLALVRPDDPHAHEWVTQSLQRAEEVGDRTAQVNSYNSLAWHHFLRARLGGADETTELRHYVDRLVETAHELGMHEMEAHGLAMSANVARLQGRVDDACRAGARAEELALIDQSSASLARVAALCADRARGITSEEPVLDRQTVDPVVLMAAYLIGEQLILDGRPEGTQRAIEAIDRRPGSSELEGVIGGFGRALSLVLLGRHVEARADAEWAIAAATTLGAPPAVTAARALLAEVTIVVDGDRETAAGLIDEAPPVSGGLAHLLVVRCRALLGDEEARRELQAAIVALRMPGLALGAPALA